MGVPPLSVKFMKTLGINWLIDLEGDKGTEHIMLVKEKCKELGSLTTQPLLQSIKLTLNPLRDDSKIFAVDPGWYKRALALSEKVIQTPKVNHK